ncbi:hypothetical protein Lal_00021161 [Lupinus albus]|nr:hypothetical protein Lal_00021161 [Lupinus albus]
MENGKMRVRYDRRPKGRCEEGERRHGDNPETYLEWEFEMKKIFDCHNYSEEKNTKVASSEFKEYFMVLWDQY